MYEIVLTLRKKNLEGKIQAIINGLSEVRNMEIVLKYLSFLE
ncbi:MAG: hypothetical protein OCC45_03140 [Desulfotalea sp.]